MLKKQNRLQSTSTLNGLVNVPTVLKTSRQKSEYSLKTNHPGEHPSPAIIFINPLNHPAVAGWSPLCYAGRCVSKTSPPNLSRYDGASLEAQRTPRRISFFIAAYQSRPVRRGLSVPPPAGEKDILLRVLCASSEAGGDVLLTHLPA